MITEPESINHLLQTIQIEKTGFWQYLDQKNELRLAPLKFNLYGSDDKLNTELSELPFVKINEWIVNNDQFEEVIGRGDTYLNTNIRLAFADEVPTTLHLYGERCKLCDSDSPLYLGYFIAMNTNNKDFLDRGSFLNNIETITKMGAFEWHMDEEYLTCSDNFYEIARLPKTKRSGKILKDDFISMIDKSFQNFIVQVLHDSISTHEPFEVSFYLSDKNHTRVKLFGYPTGDAKHNKLNGLLQDISRQENVTQALISGQDSERKRISRDLHDGVGQKLIAVKYKLALLALSNNPDQFKDINKSLDNIIEEIRNITHNLSSQIVKELGLKVAINQVLEEAAGNLKADKSLLYQLNDEILNDYQKKMLYRIIQEVLSNAVKHSRATNLKITLRAINDQVYLMIEDNGKGFDLNQSDKNGIGIHNVRERVTILNGFLKIETAPKQGTVYKILFPPDVSYGRKD